MDIEVKVPMLSDKMKKGRIASWHVEEGQYIQKGVHLFDITVNKMNFKVYSDYQGMLTKIVCPTGSTVQPGDVVAVIAQVDEVQATAVSGEMTKQEYKNYDVAIIGAGPGGYVAAIKAAKKGAKVALFEKDKLGGTCLNRGCIPTKSYARAAEVYGIVRQASQFGLDVNINSFAYLKVVQRKDSIVEELREGIDALLKSNGVDVFYSEAKVDKEKNIIFGENKLKAKNIIIATGSSPAQLPIKGIDSKNVMNSDIILDIKSLPQSLCIIGGGVIGMEFAFIMNRFGVKVSVVEMMPNILPTLDHEVSLLIKNIAESRGIRIYTSSTVDKIEEEENGGSIVCIKGENTRHLYVDKVFVSIGRKLNTDIGPIADLLEFDGKAIKVDEYMRTNVDGVYAIGDVTGKMMLAHVASAQGEVAVDNIFGEMQTLDYTKIPAAVFTEPEIGYFGYTEEQAREKFGEIRIGRFDFEHNGRAKTYGETEGFVKVIASKTGEVVGAWIIGSGASELIHTLSTACQAGMDVEALRSVVYSHPTRSETIMEAIKDIFGQSIHKA